MESLPFITDILLSIKHSIAKAITKYRRKSITSTTKTKESPRIAYTVYPPDRKEWDYNRIANHLKSQLTSKYPTDK